MSHPYLRMQFSGGLKDFNSFLERKVKEQEDREYLQLQKEYDDNGEYDEYRDQEIINSL